MGTYGLVAMVLMAGSVGGFCDKGIVAFLKARQIKRLDQREADAGAAASHR